MAVLVHELWVESESEQTFCLSGPMGADARALMSPGARLVWTVEAGSHFEAMSKYYQHMDWGVYTTEHEWEYQLYPDEWLRIQRDPS